MPKHPDFCSLFRQLQWRYLYFVSPDSLRDQARQTNFSDIAPLLGLFPCTRFIVIALD